MIFEILIHYIYMETNVKLYALKYNQAKTYLMATLFVVGNILLPQLCHLVPQGGLTFLPIYFFTLIAAYKFGWQVGLLTAVFSPLVNSALFSMPAPAVLPSILIKSVLLALMAAYMAQRTQKAQLWMFFVVVLGYQLVGSLVESLMVGSFAQGFQDFRIGIPGMLIQIFGAFALIHLFKK